ncbi:MAG: hypothetical protein ACI8ZF_000312 [Candidatus Midichloriaceae bacterium]|jgi:hypothetical protein
MNILSKILFAIFLVLGLSSCTGNLTSVRHSGDYLNNITRYQNIVILPPEVEVFSVAGSNKKKRLYDYELHLEDVIKSNVSQYLEAKGFRVTFLTRRDIQNKELYGDVLRFKTDYSEKVKNIYKTALIDKKKAFDTNVNIMNTKPIGKITNSDLILVVEYSSFFKTTGAKTLEFMQTVLIGAFTGYISSSGDDQRADMLITLIDSKTGDFVWSNNTLITNNINAGRNSIKEQNKIDNKRLKLMLNILFKPFMFSKN